MVVAEAEAEARPTASSRLVPLIIGCALFMQLLDSTIVANALPAMALSLGEDPVALNVTITAYLLAGAVFIPISAWLADRYGSRNVLRAAIAAFATASLLCGLAQTLPQLVIGRILQGFSGALFLPVGRLVLLRSVPKSELVRAMAYLSMPAVLGPILGPPLGGFIVTYADWPWIFYINIPIALVGIVLVSLFIPDIRETVTERLDGVGLLWSGTGLACLVFGFDNLARQGLAFALALATLVVGLLCFWLYVRHERRTPRAILDLSLLHHPTYAASTLGGLFPRLVLGASPFLLALLLQLGFHLSAFEAGLITCAGAIGAFAMKLVVGPIIRGFGFKRILIFNSWFLAAMFAGYMLFTPATPNAVLVAVILTTGFFNSLQFTALSSIGFADIPAPDMSRATSLASMAMAAAQSLGIGIAALIVQLLQARHPGTPLEAGDVTPAFLLLGLLSLLALPFFARLPREAGAHVAGRR